jgi:hypothetical protein
MAKKMKKATSKEITITGFIEEIELEDGEMGLQIDDGDDVYMVFMDTIGSKLQNHIDEEIDVTGLATITADMREIRVKKFRPAEDYYYDDDDSDVEDDDNYFGGHDN